uniref:rab effector MyRIP isoform X3 n=1 Tax=Ciona intestinalis TaxID=7719 RepID=UPI000EF4C052|nr:rab effector MyRIP isoform X3 [Ciona intestinalis]|eukprot:XP_026691661.1 rab effector MyRIP isoform X3 [Ciona intestinalis]
MGRKLELNELSDDEQKMILEVIQRDFDLRKQETERIGELSKTISETESVEEKTLDNCAVCGNGFVWLFRPKAQCLLCRFYFCKNNDQCGLEENEKWFCSLCYRQREVTSKSADWFYLQLKSKFRRHGGAKIVRELYKKKKIPNIEEAPEKPPRIFTTTSTATDTKEEETDNSTQDNKIEIAVQTIDENGVTDTDGKSQDHVPPNFQSDMKRQLEEAIAAVLLPRLEEMHQSSNRNSENDAASVAEETIERFLRQMEMKTTYSGDDAMFDDVEDENDALLCRYLQDHKHNIKMRFARKLQQASPRSSLDDSPSLRRDVETMTEDNTDSEMESLLSFSGSARSSRRDKTPLSERMRNLSPDSRREALNQRPSVHEQRMNGHGAARKDEMIAKADVDATFAQLLESNPNDEQEQEFSTELECTTFGDKSPQDHERRDSNTSESSNDEKYNESMDDNWMRIPKTKTRKMNSIMATGRTNAYVPLSDSPSAYDHVNGNNSDSDVDNCADEDEIWPVQVSKNFSEAPTLGSESREVVDPERLLIVRKQRSIEDVDDAIIESMNRELESSKTFVRKEGVSQLPLIEEEPVVAVDRNAREMYQKVLPLTSAVAAFQGNNSRASKQKHGSQDSAYNSESDATIRSRLNETFESDTFSSSSSLDGSMRSTHKQRSSLFYPEKDEKRKSHHEKQLYRLKSNEEILKDDISFGDRLSDAISRQWNNSEMANDNGEVSSSSESDDSDIETEIEVKEKVNVNTITVVTKTEQENQASKRDDHEDVETVKGEYKVEEEDVCRVHIKAKYIKEGSLEEKQEKTSLRSSTSDESYTEHDIEVALDDVSIQSEDHRNIEDEQSQRSYDGGTNQEEEEEKKPGFQIKSISEIVSELKNAGLEVEKGAFKRNSVATKPTAPRIKETTKTTRVSDPGPIRAATPDESLEWATSCGITIDPSKYKSTNETKIVSEVITEEEAGITVNEERQSDDELETSRLSVETSASGESLIKEPGDSEYVALPSVAERRSVFSNQAKPTPSPRLSRRVTSTQQSFSGSEGGNNKTRTVEKAEVASEKTDVASDVLSSKDNDSESDTSSLVSSHLETKHGYDADTSTITSDLDDERRSMTSPVTKPPHTSEVVIMEHCIETEKEENVETEKEVQKVEISPRVSEIKCAFELDRSSPVRGSITMRGSRMVMTVQPDQGTRFQNGTISPTSDTDDTRRRPFVLDL